jgi:ribosomal protein S27AE
MMKKECFKCKKEKDLSEFYCHPKMADGHLNKCKCCNKKDSSEHRNKNIEKVREYDRERGKRPERIKIGVQITKIWRAKDIRRQRAHNAVHAAIKSGKLVRQSCLRCEHGKTIAHHEDYSKPLDVIWLCQPCHKTRHKEIDALAM